MARQKVSMSQHIRDVLSESPGLTGPEIIAALAKKGHDAKSALVYYVKARFKPAKHRKKAAPVASSNGTLDPVALISKTKALAADVGGMSKLKELVEALS